MDESIVLHDEHVAYQRPLSSSLNSVFTVGLPEFVAHLAHDVGYDTGILPPGVVAIRRQGNRAQYVLQFPPGLYNITWGEVEDDEDAQVYRLAMPFRVVFCEYEDNRFVGLRMFYTLKRIDSYDDVLYHTNLPNVNCRGYNNTSVGWVCLYHDRGRGDQSHLKSPTIDAQRLVLAGLRASGNEAFNNENMSETDGPGFYSEHRPNHLYLSNASAWEHRSDRLGWSWTLEDSDLWVPVLVNGPDDQSEHEYDGMPLTVGMVMHGISSYYYSDTLTVRPFNDPNYLTADHINERLRQFFTTHGTSAIENRNGAALSEPQDNAGNLTAQVF